MSDIFLSYASTDRERVKPLVSALEKRGWSVWWDRTILPGQDWDHVIQSALGDARCVIVLWTRESVNRRWVKNESREGLRREVLIPALLDEVTIPLEFSGIQSANLTDWSGQQSHPGFDQLLLAISRICPAAQSSASLPATTSGARTPPAAAAVPKDTLPPYLLASPKFRKAALAFGLLASAAIAIFLFYTQLPVRPSSGQPGTTSPPAENQSRQPTPDIHTALVAGQTRDNPKDGLLYVWIPPGRFTMGCSSGDTECLDLEKPAHEVTITRGFWMGQTEVTDAAYARFAAATGKKHASVNPDSPAVNVTWDDARGYCGWAGMRLATEAEWEYAVRAGTTTSRYGDPNNVAWFGDNSGRQPLDTARLWALYRFDSARFIEANGNTVHPVHGKQPNDWGLYDALGNAIEWVMDWFDPKYYERKIAIDPPGPSSGEARVLRGGSVGSNPQGLRVSDRNAQPPWELTDRIGFRCAGKLD